MASDSHVNVRYLMLVTFILRLIAFSESEHLVWFV